MTTDDRIFEAIKEEYRGGALGSYARKQGLSSHEWIKWKRLNPGKYKELKAYKDNFEWIDKDELREVLERFNWSQSKAAKALGLSVKLVFQLVSELCPSEEDLFYNRHKHEIGRKSGDLVVTGIKSSRHPNGHSFLIFECQCSCGNKTDVAQGNFNGGLSTRCDECRRRNARVRMRALGKQGKGISKKPVRCKETGQIFHSIREAVQSLGGKTSEPIRRQLKGHQKTAFGCTWEEV